MKHLRSAAALAAALALAVTAAGCGASSSSSQATSSAALGPAANYDYQNFTYSQGLTAEGRWEGVRALDYVTLPEDFAAIPLKKADIEPTEEDIQSLWDNLLESNRIQQPVTGRAAEEGDIANIDYSGTVDGVVFTGGTAEGYDLTLGSGTFIPGFEDQIVGHNIGDSFDVTVTFPDDYGDSTDEAGNTITLSGKEAVFRVTLNSLAVSVLPEATDAWVEENFGASNDLHTVAELDQYFHDNLYTSNLTNAVVDYLTENSQVSSIPDVVRNYQVCSQLSYYNSYASMFGYETLDEFLSGFEEQIVGHNVGDSFDVTITFPDGYGDSTDADGNVVTLSGKEAVFHVTLNSLAVSVLPEATDAWVEENFGASNDLHTVADVDQYFHDSLYSSNLTNAVVDYLTENSTVSSIPEVVLNYQVCSQLSYYNSYAAMFGYETLDEFLAGFMGYDNADALLADTEQDVLNSCNQLLIFQAVAESLDLAPTEAELETYASYTESMGEGYVHLLALQDSALSALRDGAVVS